MESAGAPTTRSSRRYRRLVANLRQQRGPCHICTNPIDYTLVYPNPRSFSAHHLRSWKTHPELREDPDNLVAAHLDCNQGAPQGGTEPFTPRPLGQPSRDW